LAKQRRPVEGSAQGNGQEPQLRRRLSLLDVSLYGLGTTVGARIYVLIGEVAGIAGSYAAIAFIVASALAALTALRFCELVSRFPRSAGEAVYVHEAFGKPRLATSIGLLVAAAGCVSAAALAKGFVGYLAELVDLPPLVTIAGLVLAPTSIAAWGIGESVRLAGLITLVEVGGLLAIIWVAGDSLRELPERWSELVPSGNFGTWNSIGVASVLAFYAFLGFEAWSMWQKR